MTTLSRHNDDVRATLTTTEAAWMMGVDRRSFARWATRQRLKPLRRQRIGRSWVTVWSIAELTDAARRDRAVLDNPSLRGEIITVSSGVE